MCVQNCEAIYLCCKGQADGAEQTPSNIRRTSSGGRNSINNNKLPLSNKSNKPSDLKRMSSSAASNNEFDLSAELNTAIMESDKALLVEAKRLNDVAGISFESFQNPFSSNIK